MRQLDLDECSLHIDEFYGDNVWNFESGASTTSAHSISKEPAPGISFDTNAGSGTASAQADEIARLRADVAEKERVSFVVALSGDSR